MFGCRWALNAALDWISFGHLGPFDWIGNTGTAMAAIGRLTGGACVLNGR